MLRLSLCVKFDWSSYTVAVAKSTSKKIETLILCEVSFEFSLNPHKSSIPPCIEGSCVLGIC